MNEKRYFLRMHPLPAFVFFVAALTVTMLSMHPVVLAASFVCAVVFCGFLYGVRKTASSLAYTFPLMVLVVLVNMAFVHRGETYLFFLNDNPVTLEALLYGVAMSVMFAAIYYWCKCMTAVMTTDKWIFLFGKILPKFSMLLALSVAFVPKFKRRYKQIDSAQRTLGVYSGQGVVDKLRYKFRVFGILVTDVLESSVTTADSMRARGFGLAGRSTYSPCDFTAADGLLTAFCLAFGVLGTTMFALGACRIAYYPTVTPPTFAAKDIVCLTAACAVFVMPIICEIKDDLLWHSLKSKI